MITVLRKTNNKASFYKIDFSEYSWQIFFASMAGEIIKAFYKLCGFGRLVLFLILSVWKNHPKGPYAENAPFDFGQSHKDVVSTENTAMADLSLSSQNDKANGYR